MTRARHYVADQLLDVPRDTADAVAIMVSELATNCVRHAGTDFTVGIEQTPRQIRVEVTDGGSEMPTLRSPEPNEPSGRGLRIVQGLADSFGVRKLPGAPGKTVWFVVDLEQPTAQRRARESRPLDALETPPRGSRAPSGPRGHPSGGPTWAPEGRRSCRGSAPRTRGAR